MSSLDKKGSAFSLASFCRFSQVSGDLIRACKYGDRMEIAPFMADLCYNSGRDYIATCDIIAAVPSNVLRLLSRKYHLASLMAQQISSKCGLPVLDKGIRRSLFLRQQTRLSKSMRIRNARGTMFLREDAAEKIKGKRILMIDDVVTTGATLSEFARILRRAGASDVKALTFSARTL